jgi:methionine-rich copper-binding protein CopC
LPADRRILRRMDPLRRALRAAPVLVAVLVALALPLATTAHSELEKASPADGSIVTAGTPDEIVLTFSETLNPSRSSIVLLDAGGAQLAKAGVDPSDDTAMRLTPPDLGAGAYEIDWTSVSLDGDLLRGKVHFTVAIATPTDTAPANATPSAVASAAPTATATTAPATPSPSAASTTTSASGADVLLPVIVAVLLVAVLGAILLRNRSTGGTRR